MHKLYRVTICSVLMVSLALSNFPVMGYAAGKTVAGYKNTYYSGTADAAELVNGVYGYDTGVFLLMDTLIL